MMQTLYRSETERRTTKTQRAQRILFSFLCVLCVFVVLLLLVTVQAQIPVPPRGTLVIDCRLSDVPYSEGKIYVDGHEFGNCPGTTVSITAGSHSVRVGETLGNNCYLVYENEKVEVLKESTQKIVATLNPSTGEKSPSLAFALGAKLLSRIPPVDDVKIAAFSPDANIIAIGAETNSVLLYNTTDGKPLGRLGEKGEYWVSFVTELSFNADGTLLASNGWIHDKFTGEINIWDLKSGRCVRKIAGVKNITSLALSPDGKLLAAGIEPNTIQLWNVADGKPLRTINPPGDSQYQINPLLFSQDNRLLISGYRAGKSIYIHDVLTAKRLRTLPGTLATLARDGRLVTYLYKENNIITQNIWSSLTGEQIGTKQIEHFPTALSMNEQILVTHFSGLSFLNLRNGQVMLTLEGHPNPIAFSADGRRILFHGVGTYVIWSLPEIPGG